MTVPRESRQDESPPPIIRKDLFSSIEESRWYGVGLVTAIVIALTVLFREFIFSNKMLFSGDVLLHGIFNRSLVADFLRGTGPFPLWNPYVSCGLPFVDAIHGAIFYPLAIIDYLGYLPRMVGFTMLAHFVLAGAATYLAARQLGLSKGAATVASVSYALSPNLLTWVAPGHEGKIYAAALFPLALYCVERLIISGRWRDLAYAGLVIGMLVLTPHLQMAYYIILTLAAFSCVRMIALYRAGLSRITAFSRLLKVGGAIVLALAVSGIQLIPSARYLLEFSPRADQERGVEYAASYSLHAEEAVALAFPDFCGMDRLYQSYQYWGKNNVKDNSEAISIVTWILAILALVFRDIRLKWFWTALAVITLLYALGDATPFFSLMTAVLPLFAQMRAPSTAMFLFSFSMAMLAGAAIDSVRQARFEEDGRFEKRIRIVMLIGLGISALYAVTVFLFPESALRAFAQLFNPQLLSSHETGGGRWERAIVYLPDIRLGAALSIVFAGMAGLLLWKRSVGRMQPLIPIALSLLIVLSNFVFVSKFIRTVDPHVLFEDNPIAKVYTRTDSTARTQMIGVNRIDFQLGYHHIPNVTGFHGKELRWFFGLTGGVNAPEALNPRFANLTGTRYLICAENITVPPFSFGPVPLDTLVRIRGSILLQNRNCFPRVFLVSEYHLLPDAGAINREVLHGTLDLRQVVLLETQPSLILDEERDSTDQATIAAYGLDSVEIAVSCSKDRMLVLTDNYYDAWHASVDGRSTEIFRADGSFRAVAVPAGSHRVTFWYSSPQLRLGAWTSVCGLIIAVGLVAVRNDRSVKESPNQ